MADKPKKAIHIGGGSVSGIEVANRHKHDSRPSVMGTPKLDDSPICWAAWIQEAQGEVAEAFIEVGRRLYIAKQAYDLKPKHWGQRWDDWCDEYLGIKRSFAHKLMSIYQTFGEENLFLPVKQILPADAAVLYGLSRLKRDHPRAFDAEVETGGISSDLTRPALDKLLDTYYPDRVKKRLERPQPTHTQLRVRGDLASLLKERAQQENITIDELLMELLTKP